MAEQGIHSTMREAVRELADVAAFDARYPDSLITSYLNQGITAYREMVGGGFSRILRTSYEATLAAAGYSIALTTQDPQRIHGVYLIDDDGTTWYQLAEAVAPRDVGTLVTTTAGAGRPEHWYFDATSILLYIYPRTDRARSCRLVYEPSAVAVQLSADGDAFDSLIARGVEWVETFAALKICARDGAAEQYQMLSAELAKAEASIRARTDASGGIVRRRDSRGERKFELPEPPVWPVVR